MPYDSENITEIEKNIASEANHLLRVNYAQKTKRKKWGTPETTEIYNDANNLFVIIILWIDLNNEVDRLVSSEMDDILLPLFYWVFFLFRFSLCY